MSVTELNNLIFERLGLVDNYIQVRKQLESHLLQANFCISKAKTTRGVTLFSIASLDTHDLEPSLRVSVQDGKFSLKDNEEENVVKAKNRKPEKPDESAKKEKEEADKVTLKNQFRPFGVLEPLSAKDARKEMRNSVEIICQLASLQTEIRKLDENIEKLYKSSLEDIDLVEKFKLIVVK